MIYAIKRILKAVSEWRHYKYQDWEFDIATSPNHGFVRHLGTIIMKFDKKTHQPIIATYNEWYSPSRKQLFMVISPEMEEAARTSYERRPGIGWDSRKYSSINCQDFIQQKDLFPAHLLTAMV
jgi:hypothetical protein